MEKMVFAQVGKHVRSPQAKWQLDRTSKLQGYLILFSFLINLISI